jgi:transposase
VKVHRHSAGARKALGPQAIGSSRGGRGTKNPCGLRCFGLSAGSQAHRRLKESDIAQAQELLEAQPPAAARRVVADRGYDSDGLRGRIKAQGGEPVIPPRKHRKEKPACDEHCYGSRHVIENFFCRIKDHRRVATRYEKTVRMFAAMVMISCILIWLKF